MLSKSTGAVDNLAFASLEGEETGGVENSRALGGHDKSLPDGADKGHISRVDDDGREEDT